VYGWYSQVCVRLVVERCHITSLICKYGKLYEYRKNCPKYLDAETCSPYLEKSSSYGFSLTYQLNSTQT
jgi:hypothetical protein